VFRHALFFDAGYLFGSAVAASVTDIVRRKFYFCRLLIASCFLNSK
jgi:hypothetical protein